MRSYEAARSLFALLSFLSWAVIVMGGIAAVFGGGAAADMMRYGEQFIGFLVGAIPGVILALMGFFGLVFAQIGRAGVDTAEYSQQSLQISRDHLEVSRQALRHGEDVKNGFAALKAQVPVPATASYASPNGLSRVDNPRSDQAMPATTYAKALEYKGHEIQTLADGYRFAGMEFKSLDAARTYIDGISQTPKTMLSSSS